ncbi:MAG: glycosyltransferase family 2 protein [Flexilinea sp.]
MQSEPKLTIIIPAYNEETSLQWLIPEVIEFCKSRDYRLIAVNDASTDNTGKILNTFQAAWDGMVVIAHKINRGYGGALSSGISRTTTPYAITIDADGQHRLEDIDALMKVRDSSDADLVIGSRSEGNSNFRQIYRSFGKKIIRSVAKMMVDVPVQDLNSGMKLYDTELAKKYLKLCPDSMAFSDVMTLIFLQQKHLVIETPIEVQERKDGKSTINTMTAFETVMQILNIVMVFNPMRIFFPVGLAAILIGIFWAIPFFIRGNGLSTVAMLLITTGLILTMLGLIAEQLAQIRKKNL